MPLSKPIITVIALYYLIGHWNSYFHEMIYLSDVNMYPLQLILYNILLMDQTTGLLNANSEATQAIMRHIQRKMYEIRNCYNFFSACNCDILSLKSIL